MPAQTWHHLHPATAPRSPQGRMRRLLADLGDPQAAWPAAVHVAGTKGKGSTVAMLAAILRAAGYKAGAYTRCRQLRRVLSLEGWHRLLHGSMLEALRRPPCMCHLFLAAEPPPFHACPAHSPHITSLHERISIGGAPISDAAFDALVARHGPAIEAAAEREAAAGQALSHFEIVTALAFKHFQEQQVGG